MVTCPACGAENPQGFNFCGACASPLLGPQATGVAEERKVVSVLFCDLVGFTARSDRADPEDVRATLRPYHARLRREIERFGGTVEKFIGDAVMAVFGAPVAHEDDAERAVRAGLRIIEAIEDLNEDGEGPPVRLAVRIGITTGEAVVALGARPEQGEGIVTGDVVNTASRLQGVAPVGTVVVGEATHRATRSIFDYEELDSVTVKGKAEPVPVWRAVSARSRYGVDVEQGTRTPLVGRDAELNLLKDSYERVLLDSTVQLVTVTGEPGVGKTRLLWEFRSFVDDRPEIVFWRQGRCLPYGEGIAFWALGEMIKSHAGVLESDPSDRVMAKVDAAARELVEDPSEAEWLKAKLSPLLGAAPTEFPVGAGDSTSAAQREEAFTAWRRFLEVMASRRPVVAVFEDLHWADPVLLEFLEHLLDWSTGVPLLVICTGRPELYERHSGWGGGKRNSLTISLSPLSEQETARLIGALLSQAVLPAETQGALIERSGGNPLYTEEFVKMLLDQGLLARASGDGAWALREGVEIPVPESVQALIAARLDTLPTARKSLLQDASVVGKVFWSGALSSMGNIEEGTVREGLHELARKELVRPARTSSVGDQSEYAFRHALIRDVAYGQIPRAARARRHVAAARWIEQTAGERVTDHADFLAHHYGQALELATAAGAADEARDLEEPARRFLVMAGDRALALDPRLAEALYGRALELFPEEDPERPHLQRRVLDAAWLAGSKSAPDTVRGLEEVIEALGQQDQLLPAAEAMLTLVHPLWFSGETARSEAVARQAVELLEEIRRREGGRARPQLAEAYSALAARLMLFARVEECLLWTEKSLALGRETGNTGVVVRGLQLRGICLCSQGRAAEGLADLREALRMGKEAGLGFQTASAYANLASSVGPIEGFARAADLLGEGIAFCEARGMTAGVAWLKIEIIYTLSQMGRWEEALAIADEMAEWDRVWGPSQIGTLASIWKAKILVDRGRVQEAASLSDEFLPAARTIKDPQTLHPALVTAAEIALRQGEGPWAIELVAAADASAGEDRFLRAGMLPSAVRVLVEAAAVKEAESFLDGCDANLPAAQHGEVSARAMLAEGSEEIEEALALHLEASRRWKDLDGVVEEARAWLGAGRCLVKLGRMGEAFDPLRRARDAFAEMGADPLVAEADDWLRQATALTS